MQTKSERPINPYDPPGSRYPISYPDPVEFKRLEKAFLKWASYEQTVDH